jgi:hypothetical protein
MFIELVILADAPFERSEIVSILLRSKGNVIVSVARLINILPLRGFPQRLTSKARLKYSTKQS